MICECKYWLEAVGDEEIDKFVKKLNVLNDYYTETEKVKVEIEGYFIAAELPPSSKHNAKTKLTIMTSDDFQRFAKRELARYSALQVVRSGKSC